MATAERDFAQSMAPTSPQHVAPLSCDLRKFLCYRVKVRYQCGANEFGEPYAAVNSDTS